MSDLSDNVISIKEIVEMETQVLNTLKYYLGYETLYDCIDLSSGIDKSQYLTAMHMVIQKSIGYMYSPRELAQMIHETLTYTRVNRVIEQIIATSATQKYNSVYLYFCK